MEAAEKLNPDVIVTDISMPLLNGIEAAQRIKNVTPKVKIVFLTMHPDVTYATRALEAGASGYVLKHAAPSELITAIKEVLNGRIYLTPMIAKGVLDSFMSDPHRRRKAVIELTPRQREVLQLTSEGRSAKEIASILNISTRTVEFHKYRAMESLGLRTSADLIQYAIKHGIVSV